MSDQEPTMERLPDFSLAFQQMASFVAIAKTRNYAEILDQLVQQCFIILASNSFNSPRDITEAIYTLFGIRLAEKDIALSVKRLTSTGRLTPLPGEQLGLAPIAQRELEARVSDAKRLEDEVKSAWLAQVGSGHPTLDAQRLWEALRAYLGMAFRRHGIQAIALLAPEADIAKERDGSLSTILDSVMREKFPEAVRTEANEAISSFISGVRSDRKRAEYIAQLADGAFNYFSLTIAPEVSERLRGKLNQLTLLLDTNFLFGILNLHSNPQVDVSAELVGAIKSFKLPFKLRYHEATTREMTQTLYYFGRELRRQKWPQHISRAGVRSEALSGIELRYHQRNAEQPTEVEDFLAPYVHWEILLKDRGIDIYRIESSERRLRARADLEAEYKEFLARAGREKPHEAIQHDMAVLETVRSLRSNAKSTLEAGAILVTCDYYLFRFDWEKSRKDAKPSCVVLPSLLWQILRPFVSNSSEFDQAFAETFALPEFTLTRGGAGRAASRMLSILAGYRDIPEETAVKMLANDLLLTELQTKKTERDFTEAVESALAQENAALMEERAALAQQLSNEKAERERRERELESVTEALRQKETELQVKERKLREEQAAVHGLAQEGERDKRQIAEVVGEVLQSKEADEATRRELNAMRTGKARAEQSAHRLKCTLAVLAGLMLAGLFELVVNSVIRWDWLRNHPNSIGLQGCFALVVTLLTVGVVVREWRKWCFGVGIVPIIAVVLQIIGGSPK